MLHYAKNSELEIAVRQPGAELYSVKSLKSGIEYMWDSNPDIWNSSAPILFPIVGGLKDNAYLWKGEKYSMGKHGFIRENPQLQLTGITANTLTFGMGATKETRKIYPFEFEFTVRFVLEGNKIAIEHQVLNAGKEEMYFSLGAHPGFKCPIHANETYEDYYLDFEYPEQVATWLVADSGLISDQTRPVLHDSNTLPLAHELFSNDALIFKDLKSRKVTLRSRKSPQAVAVSFNDFPYLGIWAKTNGDFVCIEPWLGVGDSSDADQVFEHKDGILHLQAGEVFKAAYAIEIIE